MTLNQQRTAATMLLSAHPADAVASYFALEHDPRRTKLFVRADAQGHTLAFVAVCQTGMDLFRPLVVLRAADAVALHELLRDALTPRRQYLISAPVTQRNDIATVCELHGEQVNNVLALERGNFRPVVNVLAQTSRTPDGQLRAFIKARDGSNAAEAGTVWVSSRYAELYVSVVEGARQRGLGKSVVSAVAAQILESGKTPVYISDRNNAASRGLAERLGFRDTGAFELTGAVSLRN
jgi:L-amino acid N-acyltransferase YncA